MAIPDHDPAKSGCLSRFLRLLLCAQSNHAPPIHSQTHSFHQNKPMPNTNTNTNTNANANTNTTIPTPGLVARLMGLDSLPNTSRVSKRVAPDSVPRSKSVNFLDYLLHYDPNLHEPNHRRVRTSSFREVPPSSSSSFHQQKNHDLVVFLWEDDNKPKSNEVVRVRPCTRQRKQEEEEKEEVKKKKKKKKISKLKNEPRRECVSPRTRTESYSNGYRNSNASSSSTTCKSWSSRTRMGKEEAFVEPRFRKSVRKQKSSTKKMQKQNECCSENLSPVSVLDVGGGGGGDDDDFTFPNEMRFSDETRALSSKSKRKCSSGSGSGEVVLYLDEDVEERGSSNEGNYDTTETEHCSELMEKLMKLTENEIRESDCRGKSIVFESESYEEICVVFERRIFDLLLREVVDELVQF